VHLRYEYRTPVNHIMGYSELLIEEAGERRWGGDEFVALIGPSSGSVEMGISRITECLAGDFAV
jgi:hypothetical protein